MAGTIRKFTLDGQTFNVAADANLTQNPGLEKEPIRHTGGTTVKTTLMTDTVDAVDVICTGQEYLDLKEFAKRKNLPMSYEEESGDVWRSVGEISLSGRETDTTKCPVTLINYIEWKPFLNG